MRTFYIVHHSADFDGCFSAFITKSGIENSGFFKKGTDVVKYVPYNYQEQLLIDGMPIQNVLKDMDVVFFVDLLYTKDINVLLEIKQYANITVIDHHRSSVEFIKKNKLDGQSWFTNYAYDSSDEDGLHLSAAGLCWKYFHGDEKLPFGLELISDYDIWNKKDNWETEVLPFQYGLRSADINTKNISESDENKMASVLYDNEFVQSYIEKGKILLDNMKTEYKALCRAFGHKMLVHLKNGHVLRTYAVPGHLKSGLVFDFGLDPEERSKYDMLVLERPDPVHNCVQVSILANNNDLDASKVCVLYGGGGHVATGGCRVEYKLLAQEEEGYDSVEFIDSNF